MARLTKPSPRKSPRKPSTPPSHSILLSTPALSALKRPQLSALCKRYSVKANGTNAELVQRLKALGEDRQDADGEAGRREEGWQVVDVVVKTDSEEGADDDEEEEEEAQVARELASPRPSPLPPPTSLAALQRIQRLSEAHVLSFTSSPSPATFPMAAPLTPTRTLSPNAHVESSTLAGVHTMRIVPSPIRPAPSSGPLLFPDPDVSLSAPDPLFTSHPHSDARPLGEVERSPRSQAKFVFGSPEPEQRAVMASLGGSVWTGPSVNLPGPSQALEENHIVEEYRAPDQCEAQGIGGPVTDDAIASIWAELDARAGTTSSSSGSFSQPGGKAGAGRSPEKGTPHEEFGGRYGTAHDKAFNKMDSIATHYAAKRKLASTQPSASFSTSTHPASVLKPSTSSLTLRDEAGTVSKRVKFSASVEGSVRPADKDEDEEEKEKERAKRRLKLAKARRIGQTESTGGPKSFSPAKRPLGVLGLGSRLLTKSIRSVRSLTSSTPASSIPTSSSAPTLRPFTAAPIGTEGAVGFGKPVGKRAVEGRVFGEGTVTRSKTDPGLSTSTSASPRKKKFDLGDSLARHPTFQPRAIAPLPSRSTPSSSSTATRTASAGRPGWDSSRVGSGRIPTRMVSSESTNSLRSQKSPSKMEGSGSASKSVIPPGPAPPVRGSKIPASRSFASKRLAMAALSQAPTTSAPTPGGAGPSPVKTSWSSSVTASTAASRAREKARLEAHSRTPRKVGGKQVSSVSSAARRGWAV